MREAEVQPLVSLIFGRAEILFLLLGSHRVPDIVAAPATLVSTVFISLDGLTYLLTQT